MILQFYQTERQPNPTFEGRIGEDVVITGKGASSSSNAHLVYSGRKIELSSTPHREKIAGKAATQVTDLFVAGERIGYVYPDLVATKKIWFLSIGYDYFVYHFDGNDYAVYEVGFGPNQHYFCVYKDNETIAIINKEDEKVNYRDKYIVYALDTENLLSLAVLTLYFDCILYPDYGEVSEESYVSDPFVTVQKDLNAKYDPTFIPKVKAMEGLTE